MCLLSTVSGASVGKTQVTAGGLMGQALENCGGDFSRLCGAWVVRTLQRLPAEHLAAAFGGGHPEGRVGEQTVQPMVTEDGHTASCPLRPCHRYQPAFKGWGSDPASC